MNIKKITQEEFDNMVTMFNFLYTPKNAYFKSPTMGNLSKINYHTDNGCISVYDDTIIISTKKFNSLIFSILK